MPCALKTVSRGSWSCIFSRGQQTFGTIQEKLKNDLAAAVKHDPHGVAFVTNQELRLGERETLRKLRGAVQVELFHLERVAHILDSPPMSHVRKQYLDIDPGLMPISMELEVLGAARYFTQSDALRDWHLQNGASKAREEVGGSGHSNDTNADTLSFGQSAVARALSNAVHHGMRPPQPQTAAQLDRRIEIWKREVHTTWPECEQYLAATAWPGLKFRVHNTGVECSR